MFHSSGWAVSKHRSKSHQMSSSHEQCAEGGEDLCQACVPNLIVTYILLWKKVMAWLGLSIQCLPCMYFKAEENEDPEETDKAQWWT